MQQKKIDLGAVIGTFSKGIAGSVALNASESGGVWCDKECHFKRQFTETGKSDCYAIRLGVVRPTIAQNGVRHRENFSDWLAALLEPKHLERIKSAPWVRFSAFGAFPAHLSVSNAAKLRELASHLDPNKTHFPVETAHKVDLYRELGFFPRLSLQYDHRDALPATGPVSISVGHEKKTANIAEARELRRAIPDAKVCPAIAGSAKCGDCRMCSGISGVPVIMYPKH